MQTPYIYVSKDVGIFEAKMSPRAKQFGNSCFDNWFCVFKSGITQNPTISQQTGMSHSKTDLCNLIKLGHHRTQCTHRLHTKTTC
jgi:hypothetical protein